MKKEPEEYKPIEYIIGLIFFIVVGFLLFKIDPIDKAKGFFDDRSSQKVRCAERADSASTSYAAKKIYKACMSN